MAERFDLVTTAGVAEATEFDQITAKPATEGPYALIEYTHALPRAKLYSNWQVVTNDQAVLDQLAATSFDPEQTVFVAGRLPEAPPAAATNASTGSVEFASYAPKDIVLKSAGSAPAVLLLNDRFDPNWKVRVDGQPEALLRCNYIMRGVYLPPGAHTVEFSFQPPVGPLYVNLAAIGVGVLLLGYVLVSAPRDNLQAPARTPRPAPERPADAGGVPGRTWQPGPICLGRRGTQ